MAERATRSAAGSRRTPLCGPGQIYAASGIAHGGEPFDLVWISKNFFESPTDYSLELDVTEVFERTNYPMTVKAETADRCLEFTLIYDPNRVESAQAQSFLQHLLNSAVAISTQTDANVNELTVLSPPEVRAMAVQSAGPNAEYPLNESLAEVFDGIAERFATKAALIRGDEKISYDELRQRANGVAEYLNSLGVSHGDIVGVAMDRSFESVIAMIGILKAGAAYLPLEPDLPEARRSFMISEAAVKAVLDQTILGTCDLVDEFQAVYPNPASAALVTFTSGSSGAPKGVPVSHRGILNRLNWHWDQFGAEPERVMAHKTSFMFVDHITELFGGMLCGRTVAIIGKTGKRKPRFIDRGSGSTPSQRNLDRAVFARCAM